MKKKQSTGSEFQNWQVTMQKVEVPHKYECLTCGHEAAFVPVGAIKAPWCNLCMDSAFRKYMGLRRMKDLGAIKQPKEKADVGFVWKEEKSKRKRKNR